MKFLTKEEEEQHFNAVLRGTLIGGCAGLVFGAGSIYAAGRRYPMFRGLRLSTQAFVLTSTTSFGAIFYAERLSNQMHAIRDPMRTYRDKSQQVADAIQDGKTSNQRLQEWGRTNRYNIVLASWVSSMAIALWLVSRSPAKTSQKLVQARVYAQGLTLAVLLATAALEVSDAHKGQSRWESVTVLDPTDPEHRRLIKKSVHKEEYPGQDLWMDIIEAEERRLANRTPVEKQK